MEPSTRQYLAQLLMGAGQGITQASQGRPAGQPGPSFAGMLGGASTGIAAQMQRYKQEQLIAENAKREQDRFEQKLALDQARADNTKQYRAAELKRQLVNDKRKMFESDRSYGLQRRSAQSRASDRNDRLKQSGQGTWAVNTFYPSDGSAPQNVLFNSTTGQTRDMSGQPFEVQGGTLRGKGTSTLAGDLPKDVVKEFKEQEAAVRSFYSNAQDALDMLASNPGAPSWTGDAAALANNITASAKSAARQMGVDIEALDPNASEFAELGIANEGFRAIIVSLGFEAAALSGQKGQALSNRDAAQFIQQVGGSSGDPRAIANNLINVINRQTRRVNDRRTVYGQNPIEMPELNFPGQSLAPPVNTSGVGIPIPPGLTAGQWDSLTDDDQEFWGRYDAEDRAAALRMGGYTK
jgi:hypothetical protein